MDNINFKYSSDELLKLILTPLKKFKNKKQVSKKFLFSDVFPTDTSTSYKNDEEITILCEHYLNALKFYKIIETIKNSNHDLMTYLNDVNSMVETEKKKNYISFYNIYTHLRDHQSRLNSFFKNHNTIKFYSYGFTDAFIECDKWFSNFFNSENWNLSNNNLRTCVVSGLIYRKNDVVQLNNDREYNKNNFKGLYHFRTYKLNEQDYICHKFIDYGNQYSQVVWNKENDNSYKCIYDSDKKFAMFEYDGNISDGKVIDLKSAKNNLRRFDFPIHEHLPFQMLPNEKKTEKENLYFGLELEVGYQKACPRNKIHQLIEEDYLKGIAICKRDGSVNNGFEINTVPMTFNYIKTSNLFFDFFEKTKNYLRSYTMENTGIHIHVSKKPLSTMQVGKMLEFTNSRINRNYIVDLSGRDPNHYCQINDVLKTKHIVLKEYGTNGRELNDSDYRALDKMRDKYVAVNVQHEETVEFRIFKGNTKPQAISRYIEFVHALVMFTKNISPSNLNYDSFISFVTTQKNSYPFLNEFNQKFLGNHKIKLKENYSYQPRILKQLRKTEIELPKIKVFTQEFKKQKSRKIIQR